MNWPKHQLYKTVAGLLTTEGLLVELHKVGEDVFRDRLLIREALKQDYDLGLAHSMHAFG